MTRLRPLKRKLECRGSCGGHHRSRGLLASADLAAADSHAVQDNGQFPSDCHARATPRRLVMLMTQARKADYFVLRISNE